MDHIQGATEPLQQSKENDEEKVSDQTCDIWVNFLFIAVSIGFCLADLPLDIYLAVNYFIEGNMWYGGQTVLLIVLSTVISSVFSIWWYFTDVAVDNSEDSKKLQNLRKICTCLMMVRLLRKLEEAYYAVKTYKATDRRVKKEYSDRMKFYAINFSILSLFDVFMANGPQVVLQLCIFAKLQNSVSNVITETDWFLFFRILLAFTLMSFSYTSYQRSIRFSLKSKKWLNIPTAVFVLVWRFFDIASRVLCLSLFASVFPYYVLLVCCTHFIGMFIWIRKMETNFLENKKKELVYNLVLAEVFVFFYFNPKTEPTQIQYTVYYVVMFLENTTLMLLWYCHYPPDGFRLIGLIVQPSIFLFAMVLMVIYYYYLHPSIGKCQTTKNSAGVPKENFETNANFDQNKSMTTEV